MSANDIQTLVYIVGIFVFFYIFLIMPQKKREKRIQEMQKSVKVGDEIVTFAGIIGKIINITDDMITIEASAEKTKLDIKKWAVKEISDTKK